VKFRQAAKMLLSLRSNPQTMGPYIQESDGLCTSTDVKDGIPEEQKYRIIDRNYTLFQSNVLHRRGMYLAMVERRLR